MYPVQDVNGYVWGSLSVIDDSRWFCPPLRVWATREKLLGPLRKCDLKEYGVHLYLEGVTDEIDAARWIQRFEEFLHDNALTC